MRRAAFLIVAFLAVPLFSDVVLACPIILCGDEPTSELDRPSCDEYEMNSSLIEALEHGDRSALTLLQQRYGRTSTLRERHRIAGALLRRVPNDGAYWTELAEHATNFLRSKAGDEYTPEFVQWCAERQWEPDDYWYVAMEALTIAGADRRSRPLLHRALENTDSNVVMIAIQAYAEQRDHAALPAIEQALNRLPEEAVWLAMSLARFATDEADRLAMKYLPEEDRELYEEWRQAR